MGKTPHADQDQLESLLYSDETEVSSEEIALHVESCELCQQRLSDLVSLESSELEVSQWLKDLDREDPTDRTAKGSQPRGSQADLLAGIDLGKPSHPEMLGRLGRYEIERVIGTGGMGIVFKGMDTELNRPVAIKILAPHLACNGAARQRFGRESRAAAAVVHEHVVSIHNVESDGTHPFIVMQYVSGESLQTRVDRLGPLTAHQILRIGIQAASGLAAAHEQGIVHRDVKPSNILLEDGVERVLLTDFGLARTVDDASLTHTGIVAGTPHYMSPEQANGSEVDYRSDLFSLGSVLYFVATGHPPFRAERAMGVLNRICHEPHRPAWQINSQLPYEVSDVIDRLLEKRPFRRFPSALAARDAMTKILQQLQNRKPGFASHIRRWMHKPSRVALVATLCLLVVGSAWIALPRWMDAWHRSFAWPASGSSIPQATSPPASSYSSPREISENEVRSIEFIPEFDSGDRRLFLQEARAIEHWLNRLDRVKMEAPSLPEWNFEIREVNGMLDRLEKIP